MNKYIDFLKKEYMTVAVFSFIALQIFGYGYSCSQVTIKKNKEERFATNCEELCLPNSSQSLYGAEDLECWCYENETTLRIESID